MGSPRWVTGAVANGLTLDHIGHRARMDPTLLTIVLVLAAIALVIFIVRR
jgi:hypothetical protein